jgi:ribonucleoside-diphosphate reductase
MFWEQNLKQFWIDTEYIPSKDIDSWNSLESDEVGVFARAGRAYALGYVAEPYGDAEDY